MKINNESYVLKKIKSPDHNKKNLLLHVPGAGDEHIVFMYRALLRQLEKSYNIFSYCTKGKYSLKDDVDELSTSILTFKKRFANFSDLKKLVASYVSTKDESVYTDYIKELYDSFLQGKEIDRVLILGGSEFVFPNKTYSKCLQEYTNSFHESNNREKVEEIFHNYWSHFPISTFMYYYSGIALSILKNASKVKSNIRLDIFIIDPTVCIDFLSKDFNINTYYFTDDQRFNRNFIKFPIGKLTYEELKQKINIEVNDKKDQDFIFGGRLNVPRGDRDIAFNRYFKNFDLKNSVIFSPPTQSFKLKKAKTEDRIGNNIIDNDNVKPPINYFKLQDLSYNKYKYSLCIRPWSYNCSINFRLYECLATNIMPFMDIDYDTDNTLGLSGGLLSILKVKSLKELKQKISYYNKHEDERLKVLDVLYKELFRDWADQNNQVTFFCL